MPKIPDSLPVKVTVSKITLEVPKSFFEQYALRAAIFVGRKGRSAATRRTKWFTLADPALVPSRTRQSVAMPTSHLAGSRRGSAVVEPEASGEHQVEEVPVEMAVLEYSGINNVVYEVDMKPLNIFDGDWVFDQKTTHPLTVFAKILCKPRPGVRIAAAKSEQESNLNEMLQMDQDEMESNESDEGDNFSNDHGDGGVHDDEAGLDMSLSGIGLTGAQMAALSGEENTNEMVMNQLRREVECKKRYLQFPKTIDMAKIVNTRAKTADYCERLLCKNAALLGSTLSFTITAELPREKLDKFKDKVRTKEDKEETKRREKEEKILEKERKNQEKEDKKRREKEEKKSGKKKEENYGADVTDAQNPAGAKNDFKTAEHSATHQQEPPSTPDSAKKKKAGFSPFSLVKNIFSKEEKPAKETPFTVKLTTTPYPYLIMLYDFELSKLVMDPVNYRAVHIRLGTDAASTEDFPRLLLDATKPSAKTESMITWYDGSSRNAVSFNFGRARIFFGDKCIRNITGFETLRALQEHERQYKEAKKDALEGSTSQRRESADGDLFREQLMNVGTQFHPIVFEPTKYSANGNQALATKFTRVTAQLIIADKVVGEVHQSDAEEKRAYVKRLKKEQHLREKEEKERLKAEKEAEKAAKKAEAKKKDGAEGGSGDVHSQSGMHDAETATTATTTATTTTSGPHTAETPATTAANHASPKPTKDSDEDSDGAAAAAGAGAEENPVYEGGAADHLEAAEAEEPTSPGADKKEKKEKREKDESRIVLNQSNSFQLSTYVINEDYMPEDGLQYRILFQTGEELTFRARRLFLPSVCAFGDDGCTREPTLGDFMSTATSK